MRRSVLVLMAVSVLGLGAAVAGKLDTNTEDVASFTTDVSISVPTTELPPVLYLRGGGTGQAGFIDLSPPPNNHVTSQLVVRDTLSVEAQADPTRYVVFRSPPAPPGGFVLSGTVTLTIEQKGSGADRLTAGLLICPATEPVSSTACTTIATAVATQITGSSQGFRERTAGFGAVDVTIPEGSELRLKIVNRAEQPPGTPVSSQDWELAWGFNPARQARLSVT